MKAGISAGTMMEGRLLQSKNFLKRKDYKLIYNDVGHIFFTKLQVPLQKLNND